APGWLAQRLFRQIKRAPVDAKQRARIEIDEGLDRFLRGEMDRFHDLRRLIGADSQGCYIKRPESFANLLEAGEVAGVATKVESTFPTQHGPCRPEPWVTVPRRARGEVLRRNTNEPETAVFALLPPVQLLDPAHPIVGKPCLKAQRH